jgi:hypothetical protein
VKDPFSFTGPDFKHGLVIFVNTTRAMFCNSSQLAFEQAVSDWIDGGFQGPPPDFSGEPPGAIDTIDAWLHDSPMGVIANTRGWQRGLHMELWVLDAPSDSVGVGACLDTDDANQMFASGTSDFNGMSNDFWYAAASDPSISRPWGLDSTAGRGPVTTPDGKGYRYSWSFHQHIPCDGAPAPVCEVAKFRLQPIG